MWLCMSITFEDPCIGQNIRIPLWHCCDIAVTVTYDCCNSTCNACNAHATKLTISLIYDATRNVVRREPALQYPSLILGCIGHIWHIQDWRLKMAGLSPCDQMDLLPDSGMLLVFPSDSFKWENQICDDKRFLRRKNPAPRHHTSYKLSTKSRFEKNKKPGLFYKRFLWRKKLIQIVNQK